jgi:hypothetical protein
MRPSMLGNKPNGHGPASVKEVNPGKLSKKDWWELFKYDRVLRDVDWTAFELIWDEAQENK